MTLSTDVQTVEKKLGVFVTAHHITLYIVLAAAIGFGIYSIESRQAEVADAKFQAAQQALAVEKDHSAQLQKQYEIDKAARDARDAQYQAAIAQIQAQTKVQIIHDQALPPADLGHRIETITGFKQGTISLNQSDDLIMPLPLAQNIVARLDQGEADATTVTKQAAIIKDETDTILQLTGIVNQDKETLKAQIDTDQKEIKKVKDDARKSMWKHVGIGIGIGAAIVGRLTGKI